VACRPRACRPLTRPGAEGRLVMAKKSKKDKKKDKKGKKK
jgi:hypothetical protein